MFKSARTHLLVAATVTLLAGPAFAHAHLQGAEPADGSKTTSPSEIDLNFSEALNLKFSGVKLVGPDKNEVTLGQPMLMDDDKMMMVPVPSRLTPGTYSVDWQVLSTDGHKTSGSYSFTVTP